MKQHSKMFTDPDPIHFPTQLGLIEILFFSGEVRRRLGSCNNQISFFLLQWIGRATAHKTVRFITTKSFIGMATHIQHTWPSDCVDVRVLNNIAVPKKSSFKTSYDQPFWQQQFIPNSDEQQCVYVLAPRELSEYILHGYIYTLKISSEQVSVPEEKTRCMGYSISHHPCNMNTYVVRGFRVHIY